MNEMNSQTSSRALSNLGHEMNVDTDRRSHESDYLQLGNFEAHNAINHENVATLSKKINILRRTMNDLKKEYNECAENHEDLMDKFSTEISLHAYTKKRQLSDAEASSASSTSSVDNNGRQH